MPSPSSTINSIAVSAEATSVIGKMLIWYSTGTNTWRLGLPVNSSPAGSLWMALPISS
jgi:hypothetical protein